MNIRVWINRATEAARSLREWRAEREIARELCNGMVALPEYRDVPMPVLRILAKLHTAAYFAAYGLRMEVATGDDLERVDREADRFADLVLELACRGEETNEEQPARSVGNGQRNQKRGSRTARSQSRN